MRRAGDSLRVLCLLAWLFAAAQLSAAEYRGQVLFNGLPVPGASITATHGTTKVTAISDEQGDYFFADLARGSWTLEITMTGFASVKESVEVAPGVAPVKSELKLLPAEQIVSQSLPAEPRQSTPAEEPPLDEELVRKASEGLLINGSVNNAAASPFSQAAAFGNNRRGPAALYNGGIGLLFENSVLDAKPFSLTGQETPKPSFNKMTALITLGGPLRIPHLIKNGPNFFVGYQFTRNRSAVTQTALAPTAAERSGILPTPVTDPLTGAPFPANTIPLSQISPQAQALLGLYPLPNFSGSRYNFQIPAVSALHRDALQSRFDKTINHKNQVSGAFGFQSSRSDAPNILGYSDSSRMLGLMARVNWSHRLRPGLFFNAGYEFTRFSTQLAPYFANTRNISGEAGIHGNNQDPINWGPPTLAFSRGIASLTDGIAASNHNQTDAESLSLLWTHRTHSVAIGGDYRRQQFNYLSQQDPRGTFTFTGAAAGSDFGGFLLGIPDTSAIAFGNADKYLRAPSYDAYFNDDWRVNAAFTLNAGVRWEYSAPITELYSRLANLDIAPGFTQAAPVLASNPVGPITGERLPASLMRPDRSAWEPRVGIAWRALSGSSLVVRAGYGVYYNTSVYQSIASQLAQQPPLSKTFSVQNSPANPLTLANAFNTAAQAVPNTFAIDPNLRVGYAQNWKLSIQRDLPGSLQLTATYLGIKGTRGLQQFLPNTVPLGVVNPCPACPAGFSYLTSNGNSTRESVQVQLRRRLHHGFTAILEYTFSKSIDSVSSLGGQGAVAPTITAANPTAQNPPAQSAQSMSFAQNGPTSERAAIAQNWLNLRAERALSSFDQRHLLSLQFQYTSGMGIGGGTLLSGWRGSLLKEWTFASLITAGTGLPLNPVYLAAVPGTGVTGTIRPDYTGAPLYDAPSGLALNPAAYAAPLPGEWGNAGRNSITGPAQFTLDATLGRTFRLKDRLNLDLRFDAVNALNNVTYTSWNTIAGNAQFGLPISANPMRGIQTTVRLRF